MPPEPVTGDYTVLRVADLCASVCIGRAYVPVLRDINLSVRAGSTLAVVGESGCGKSTLALAMMRLLDTRCWRLTGEIDLHASDAAGELNLLAVSERAMQRVRGRRMAMIFQDARAALNPVMSVGAQVAEALCLHRRKNRRQARGETLRLLGEVAIDAPEVVANRFAHELSGGLAQRAAMAIAVAAMPDVLIADEPTSSLDAPVAGRVLDLLADLQSRYGLGVVVFTHDLSAVADRADDIAVLYAGQIVEQATRRQLFDRPLHPYTRALLACDPAARPPKGDRAFPAIYGSMPRPGALPAGCPYHPRCALSARLARRASLECRVRLPNERIDVLSECVTAPAGRSDQQATPAMPLTEVAADHRVACPLWSQQPQAKQELGRYA